MIVGSVLLILVAVVLLVLGLTNGSSLLLTGSIAASLLAAVALVIGARQDAATSGEASRGRPDEADDEERTEREHRYALAGARSGRSGQEGGRSGPEATRAGYPADDLPAESATVTLPVQAPGKSGYGSSAPDTNPGTIGRRSETPVPISGPPSTGIGADATTSIGTGGVGPTSAGMGLAERTTPGGASEVDSDLAGADVAGGEFDDEDPPDEPVPQAVGATEVTRVARLSVDVLVIDGRPRYHLPGCVHLLGREGEPLPVSEAVELGFTPCSLCEPVSVLLADPRLG